MPTNFKVNITIPTFNRAYCLSKAIEAALSQTYPEISVTVVDDGSKDETWRICQRYSNEPNFSAICLEGNYGTAIAKNVSIALSSYDAITFHDSDDIPSVDKINLQARAMVHVKPISDSILNWQIIGKRENEVMPVDIVVGAYHLVKANGEVHIIDKRVSLVDDFFPNVQFPSKTEGDWCLINSGLFRKSVFEKIGGFLNSIEEDREIRNRAMAFGSIFYFLNESLLNKYEQEDSLTSQFDTGYKSIQRASDRREVWERARLCLQHLLGQDVSHKLQTPIDLAGVEIGEVINPRGLQLQDTIPMTFATRSLLCDFLKGDRSTKKGSIPFEREAVR